MKGKGMLKELIRKKYIIVTAIILIITILSGISVQKYKSDSLKTNLGKAQLSNYPITGIKLAQKAIDKLGKNYDCSGLIESALKDLSATNLSNSNTVGWNNGSFTYEYNKVTYGPKELETTSKNGTVSTWYSKVEDIDNLPIGTIISGHGDYSIAGHVFMYLGKADSYEDLCKNLTQLGITGLPSIEGKEYNSSGIILTDKVEVRKIGKNEWGGDYRGGKYWYIEGNSSTNKVRIRNFDWNANDANSVKNMKKIRVWKITENPSGSYHMNIVKKDSEDNKDNSSTGKYSDALEGAKFTVKQYIDGNKSTSGSNGYTIGSSTVVTQKGDKSAIYFNNSNNISIKNVGNYDSYIIKEDEAPSGYKKDNDWTLELRVYKDLYWEGNNPKYGISKIQICGTGLSANGKTISLSNNNESKWLRVASDGSYTEDTVNYKVGFEFNRSALTVTWKNPKDTKDVPIEIIKKNEMNRSVNDAEFYYWVFGDSTSIPLENGTEKNPTAKRTTSAGNCSYTISKMKRGETKYVWIREVSTAEYFDLGYFDTSDSSNVYKYVALKVYMNENGEVSVSRAFSDTYLVSLSGKFSGVVKIAESTDDNALGKANYIKTAEIKFANNKVEVPIINPDKTYKFEMAIGKKSTNSKLSLSEKDLIKGATFIVRSANIYPTGMYGSVEDALNGKGSSSTYNPDAKKGTIVSENGKYSSLLYHKAVNDNESDSLIPTLTINPAGTEQVYEIEEKNTPDGYKFNVKNKIYIKVEFENSDTEKLGQVKNIKVYEDLDASGNLSNEIELNSKLVDNDTIYYPKDNSNYNFALSYSESLKRVYFIIENNPIEGNYDINLAKVDKTYLDNNGDEDFVDILNNADTKAGAVFNIRQRKNESTIDVDEKEGFTTTGNGIDSVYSQVKIEGIDKKDIYEIQEISAPEGFDLYKHKVQISVNKKVEDNANDKKYSIKGIEIGIDINDNGVFEESEITSVERTDKTRDFVKVNENVYVAFSSNSVLFVLGDDLLSGSYKMNIVKKELKNDKSDSDNYISTISDAKFSITQILNDKGDGSQVANSVPDENGVVSKSGEISNIVNNVEITDISKPDTYTITETGITPGFNLDNMNIVMKVYKRKLEQDHKYIIDYISLSCPNISTELNVGEKVYLKDGLFSNNYFSDYVVAIELEEVSTGDYNIKLTWRNERPTYDINLFKTSANTGNLIESPFVAKFDIKLYKDETFTNEAEFINKNGENLNKQYVTSSDDDSYGTIGIKDILMPEIINNKVTNYLAISEIEITGGESNAYNKFSGVLVIPITFERTQDGKITYTMGEKYVVDNITEKNKLENLINEDNTTDDDKITVEDSQGTINITVPNKKDGISISLIKQWTPSSGQSSYRLNDVEFEISITKEGENEPIYKEKRTTGENGNNGEISTSEIPINANDKFKIKIVETSTLDEFNIPKELQEGIEYEVTVSSDFRISLQGKESEYVKPRVLYNRRILFYIENDKKPINGNYKINLVKSDEDGNLLEGVTFHRDATINKNDAKQDEDHNITYNKDLSATNSDGIVCVTEDIGNNGLVGVISDNYSSPDEYELSEINLGNNEGKYVKLKDKIKLKVNKGKNYLENKTYASSYMLNIRDQFVYINIMTNKMKVWQGTEDDINNAEEQDYIQNSEIPIRIEDVNNIVYTVNMKIIYDSIKNETNITLGVVNPKVKSGNYNFRITKQDVTGKIIENETTRFDVKVYSKVSEQNGKVTFNEQDSVVLKNSEGIIKTTDLTAITGVTTGMDEIVIQDDDLGKTYYFVVTETISPDKHTKIDYDVVIPITYSVNQSGYVATKGEAFAVMHDGTKKNLSEMSNNSNECVSTDQVDVTINVKVPNKGEKIIPAKSKEWRNVTNPNLYKVVIELHKNGEDEVLQTKEIIGNSKVSFDELDKYDENGKEIQYEAVEKDAYYRKDESSNTWIKMTEGADYNAGEENGVLVNTVINPGSYNVYINKVDENGKAISEVTFNVNGTTTKPTNSNGKVKIVSNMEINNDNVDVIDLYDITEVNVSDKYYKLTDNEKISVRVSKMSDVENGQIIYKLKKVEIDGGTVDSNRVAKKNVKLENGETVEVKAEILGTNDNMVSITIVNNEKFGSYKINLIKYKKGTKNPVAGAKFHLIGGNLGNQNLQKIVNGTAVDLSRENYDEIITNTTPVKIKGDENGIAIRDVNTPDNFKLIEADVGENNSDMYLGFDEEIKVTINKNSDYKLESVDLSINDKKITTTDLNGNITYSKYIDGQTIKVILKVDKSNNTITLEVENPVKEGMFNFDLVKYIKGTSTKLPDAGFKIKIINKENGNAVSDLDGNIIDGTKEYVTDNEGKISIEGINIEKDGITYEITISESKTPDGYIGLNGPITFTAVSEMNSDGKTYSLKTNKSTTITNAKIVEIKTDEVLVETENKQKPEIHKGVKDIKNQSSGYYNEITGEIYENEEDAKKVLHDWVINTSLPQGVEEYTVYEISDTIDERLTYEGIASVKIIDGENTVAKLVEGTDYEVNYNKGTRLLTITFIKGNRKLSNTIKQNIGKIIEIRFYTKFALDDSGNIIALNQSVPNQATLTYENGKEEVIKSEKPEVHTGGVGLFKYDVKTGKALQGAHFKIATSKENALNQKFLKDTTGKDVEVISNEKGVVEFTGLQFGEDALNKAEYKTKDPITGADVYKYDWEKVQTTYYIVETEAPDGYSLLKNPIEAIVKKDNYNIEDITSLIQVGNKSNIYDLALRKFITGVKDGATGEEQEVTSRIPQVDLTKLASGESTTATYTHPKDPVLVHTTDTVTYTIRVYNEGPQDAYASVIKDDIPEGLQFVEYTNGDGSINDKYRWKLVDENDNEVTDISKAKYIVTDYLSKDNEKTAGEYLLQGYNSETMKELDYKDVKVQFKVTEPTTSDRILVNYAQISKETNDEGTIVKDRDSIPNVWNEGEDDQDIEKVRVKYFDLALRKWVTQAIVTENGKTVITQTGHKAEDDPEEVVKVDLKKSKINNVTVKFKYSIRITNEGEIAGEATEIRDDIPQGLKFVAEDNPDWRVEDGQIVTDKLAGTTLQPGESAEVEILLTWVNSKDNMGVMINTAEINKDHNDYGTPDIDSTPGNNVPKEDDIDDAPVMLTVKTGADIIMYISIAVGALAIVTAGAIVVKKKVLENN